MAFTISLIVLLISAAAFWLMTVKKCNIKIKRPTISKSDLDLNITMKYYKVIVFCSNRIRSYFKFKDVFQIYPLVSNDPKLTTEQINGQTSQPGLNLYTL